MSTTTISAADRAATASESALRRDYARFHNLRTIAAHADTPAQARELLAQATTLADRWTSDPDHNARALWRELDAAVGAWNARPETTARAFRRLSQARNTGDLPVDDRSWRTLRQAAELTGHLTTTIVGSNQDSARWTPALAVGQRRNGRGSLLDRALGGRAANLVTLDEVDAVIANTDRLLAIEEACGDRDTGTDDHTSLLPPQLRPAPPSTAAADADARRINALITLQNLTAEHARLAGEWDGPPEAVDTLVARLESLQEAIRTTRRAATAAGVPAAEIEAAHRAGSDGRYWQPPVPSTHADPGRGPDATFQHETTTPDVPARQSADVAGVDGASSDAATGADARVADGRSTPSDRGERAVGVKVA
ncbi:hypothetical protein IU438_18725 [Nocardia cyriacigeorgica]|uniref:hypothetical protein n=1 Tax=Nocardia cyriacigeorgica TaxID=135487 RepID=UPI001892E3D4|nr:hypothetical protein [Nocardia cyriacigeorgica]MBF6397827.1 hypothetical protein [Nocardia cyriacigeorgica]MBF6402515.1 hypothetical protein [Nocardia cyriacigeorgica]